MVKLGLGATLGLSGIAIIGILAFVFRDKISDFFSKITGGAEAVATAGDITNTALDTLAGNQQGIIDSFTGLNEFIANLFNQNQPPPETFTPPVPNDQVIVDPIDLNKCECGGVIESQFGITFGVCNECQAPPGFIGPIEPPLIPGGIDNTFGSPPPPFIPAPEPAPIGSGLPPGFEINVTPGSMVPGGSINETPITCNSSLGFIIDKLGVSASQAADIRAQACNDFGGFDFGTNTGSGFGPGDDPLGPIVTGGATLESEEQRAACTTCEMFGLNCGICQGSI